MTAAADLLRVYLEGQADLGTDEVFLTHPWKPAPPAEAQPAAKAAPAAVRPLPFDPDPRPVEKAQEPTQPPDDLFASLSRALEAPKAAATAAAHATAAAKARAPEASGPPAFADLAAYWAHLEAAPHLAAGETSPSPAVTRVVRSAGGKGAPLALVGLEPGEADLAAGIAFQGEPGALLAKMLKAIRLEPESCYRTNLIKAGRASKAGQRELLRLVPWLHAELSLAGGPFTLLLGEACARAVLKVGKPIAELRQEAFWIDGRGFAVTFHPRELLEREELKRQAWEDLQWLQKKLAEGRNG